MNNPTLAIRSAIIASRTYQRELAEGGQETWPELASRVIMHQEWLADRMGDPIQFSERMALEKLILEKKALPSGRTLWLGGTEIARRRESSQFNCSFLKISKVPDVVDALWLLLQGCGVGFWAVPGSLHGFADFIPEVTVIRSTRTDKGGDESNKSTYDKAKRTWTLTVGDSAEAWAKSIGILLSTKIRGCRKLVLDFSQIRPAGNRLNGYGWISSGDDQISMAFPKICEILNRASNRVLTAQEIRDIVNLLGTILSSRRSAEISLAEFGVGDWAEFAGCKYKGFSKSPEWFRCQSNNTLVFTSKPTETDLLVFFDILQDSEGGAEPGLMNMTAAKLRAEYCSGTNPCGEILLPDMGFCNLVEINLNAFDNFNDLRAAAELIARANFRQACVNLKDGILQHGWHENNDALRLCGVSVTGIVQSNLTDNQISALYEYTHKAVNGIADDCGLPRPRLVTCVKPSGTLSKVMGCTEGIHRPISKYILNYIQFSIHSPLVSELLASGFPALDHPFDSTSILIGFPIAWENVDFGPPTVVTNTREPETFYLDQESAVDQLNRYKRWNTLWSDHNSSITVSYYDDEKESIIDWLLKNWDCVVGISFMRRVPALAKPEHGYNPQQAISKEHYERLQSKIVPTEALRSLLNSGSPELLESDDLPAQDCIGGACPVR